RFHVVFRRNSFLPCRRRGALGLALDAGVPGGGATIAADGRNLVTARKQAFVFWNLIIPVLDEGSGFAPLAVQGLEFDNPLVQGLALEDDLASNLVANPPAPATAEGCAQRQAAP